MEKYVYCKEALPKPILEGHSDWLELYYRAWELAFRNIEYIEQERWVYLLDFKNIRLYLLTILIGLTAEEKFKYT